ncbi:hypothetical protein [Tardiphaga sp. 367_B4_N1_1]|uniref:hypothetical protein n=1 Tax=Tardiphaga sp. 367_B4_N1_1 TaxID=3240777 RepID=UPI003F294FE1
MWFRRNTIDQKATGSPAGPLSGSDRFIVAQDGSEAKISLLSALLTFVSASFGTIASQNASAVNITGGTVTGTAVRGLSTPTLSGDAAPKSYVDGIVAAQDAMVFKGALDCSANPNYPAADRGWSYRVSVAGKIGGASGVVVEVGDLVICNADSTAAGNQAGVGSSWNVIQTNIDGAAVGPSSAVDGNLALFNGVTGKILKDGGAPGLKSKVIATTRVLTAASGNVAYTGVGFKPSAIVAVAAINTTPAFGVGFSDAALGAGGVTYYGNNHATFGAFLIEVFLTNDLGSDYQTASVASYDADGFTLAWTKNGSPTGTANLYFLCLR